MHGSLRATADTYAATVLKIQPDEVVFSAAKLFFAYGLGNAMTFPMAVGATTVLLSGRPTPDNVFAVLDRFRPGVFYGVPTLYAALLSALDGRADTSYAYLRRCISAGEALPEEIGKNWKARVGVDILDGVGSTELLHIFLTNTADSVEYGSSGRAVAGYDLRLVDEHGAEVAADQLGELLVKRALRRRRLLESAGEKPAPRLRASGRAPATNTGGARTVGWSTAVARMICSRSAASGWRRSRWSRRWCRMPRSWRPRWWRPATQTGSTNPKHSWC